MQIYKVNANLTNILMINNSYTLFFHKLLIINSKKESK